MNDRVDIKSQKLLALAMGMGAANRKGGAPGLRPVTIGLRHGDHPELLSLVVRLASLSNLGEAVTLMTAEQFEKYSRTGSDPGVAVAITDGQNLSRAIQARIVGQGLPGCVTLPPAFVVATPCDPGDLVVNGKWVLSFRGVFQRHWRWPSINDRKSEWVKLFRFGVELESHRSGKSLPEIEPAAFKMVRALSFGDDDGARALIRLGSKTYRKMAESNESRIRSKHLLVALPGSSSPQPKDAELQPVAAE